MFAEAWNLIWRLQRPVFYNLLLSAVLPLRTTKSRRLCYRRPSPKPQRTQAFELHPSSGHKAAAEAEEFADYLGGAPPKALSPQSPKPLKHGTPKALNPKSPKPLKH